MSSERTVASALPSRNLVSVHPTDTVLQAAVLMAEANCGSALVLSAGGAIIGIITVRDIIFKIVAAALDPAATSVEHIMTHRPICAHPEMLVTHALYTMKELGFRHFPVIDASHKPLGVFSLRDAFPEELAGAGYLSYVKEKITSAVD